ncbi:MAG: COX15/CtaA family protein [Sphingomonadales bacterium]
MLVNLEQEAAQFAAVHKRREAVSRRAVGLWLAAVACLILLMVMVGGATRLTESGLSMVDWRPVTGFVPPLSEAAWLAEFEKYRASPEYQQVNAGMSLEAFKSIYHWEFWHRNLGRFIGLAFALPLLVFLVRRSIPKPLTPRLVLLLILGGGQGALGWFMVQSGLVDEPAVSHYRLAAHLSLALILFSAVFWTALDLLTPAPQAQASGRIRSLGWAFLSLLALQIVYGAFVAGLDAGYAYNTWPDMSGYAVPPETFAGETLVDRLFNGFPTVQFLHRILAYCVCAAALYLAVTLPKRMTDKAGAALAVLLLAAVIGQALIGIFTLLNAVPVWLGTMHQGWAVVVLAVTLALLHRMKQRRVWAV